jgi:hypothetical protein
MLGDHLTDEFKITCGKELSAPYGPVLNPNVALIGAILGLVSDDR